MFVEHPSTENGDDIAQVERNRSQRKYGVRRYRTRKVEQSRKNADDRRTPDGAEGSMCYFGILPKVTTIRQTYPWDDKQSTTV